MRARTTTLALAAGATLLLAACGGGGDQLEAGEDGLTPLTVLQITTMDAGPLHLGVEEGFFEEEGLDVDVQIAEAGSAIVPSVVNQESPIGYANAVSDLQAIDQGLDVRFVAVAEPGAEGVVSDESLDVRWWPVDALPNPELAELVDLALAAHPERRSL